MGTISQLFETGGQSANEGLFKNLVMLARLDGGITDAENALLKRTASRLSLTDEQVKEILRHPEQYPMIPPVSKEERFERFVQFVEMTMVDGSVSENEDHLLETFGVALGFHEDESHAIALEIIEKMKSGLDKEQIVESMM